MMDDALLELAKRHPVLGGIVGMSFGLSVLLWGAVLGAEYSEFVGGVAAVGRVENATEDAARTPRYAAHVTWVAGGVTHRALVEVLKTELPAANALDPARRLYPGSALPLVLSTKNADRAISARTLREAAVISVADRSFAAVPLVVGLAVCLLVNPIVLNRMGREREVKPPRGIQLYYRVGTAIGGGLFLVSAAVWALNGASVLSLEFRVVSGLGLFTLAARVYQSFVEGRIDE
jgi:hypothetical protein